MSKGGRIEDGRANGVLEISRTLGNSVLGECVRATAGVRELEIREDDQFLILACDGGWNVMNNRDAVDRTYVILHSTDNTCDCRVVESEGVKQELVLNGKGEKGSVISWWDRYADLNSSAMLQSVGEGGYRKK
jgi:serine/threonine protein phosphatase PrpC